MRMQPKHIKIVQKANIQINKNYLSKHMFAQTFHANVNPCYVTYLTFLTHGCFLDFKEKEKSYRVISWLPPEDYNKGLKENFDSFMEEALGDR